MGSKAGQHGPRSLALGTVEIDEDVIHEAAGAAVENYVRDRIRAEFHRALDKAIEDEHEKIQRALIREARALVRQALMDKWERTKEHVLKEHARNIDFYIG